MIQSYGIKVGSPDEWADAFNQFFLNNPNIKLNQIHSILYAQDINFISGQIIYWTPPIVYQPTVI